MLGGAAQPARDLVDDRRDDAAAERVDDVVRARRVRSEHEALAGAGGDVLALVAIAEHVRRRADLADVAPERGRDPRALRRELRRVREVLPRAAAASSERRTGGCDAVGARRAEPAHDVAPCLGLVRARVRDVDLGALAGKQIRDVDADTVRGPDAAAGLVEGRREDVAPPGLHDTKPSVS